jgi:hypothetical protein
MRCDLDVRVPSVRVQGVQRQGVFLAARTQSGIPGELDEGID